MHFAAISSRCKTKINFLFYLFFEVKKKDLINVYVVTMACQICFILREKKNYLLWHTFHDSLIWAFY